MTAEVGEFLPLQEATGKPAPWCCRRQRYGWESETRWKVMKERQKIEWTEVVGRYTWTEDEERRAGGCVADTGMADPSKISSGGLPSSLNGEEWKH